MFMHIHGRGHCDIRLSKNDQVRVLAQSKARPHRWVPSAGYVTFKIREGKRSGTRNGTHSNLTRLFRSQSAAGMTQLVNGNEGNVTKPIREALDDRAVAAAIRDGAMRFLVGS
jgi:Family of unknown function (DUF5519)